MHDDTTRSGDPTRSGDTTRPNDWTGEEWAEDETKRQGGTGQVPNSPAETADETDRWNKTQWVGDQGHGVMPVQDPDTMPEGENDLSGFRHNPGESHFAEGQAEGTAPLPGESTRGEIVTGDPERR